MPRAFVRLGGGPHEAPTTPEPPESVSWCVVLCRLSSAVRSRQVPQHRGSENGEAVAGAGRGSPVQLVDAESVETVHQALNRVDGGGAVKGGRVGGLERRASRRDLPSRFGLVAHDIAISALAWRSVAGLEKPRAHRGSSILGSPAPGGGASLSRAGVAPRGSRVAPQPLSSASQPTRHRLP